MLLKLSLSILDKTLSRHFAAWVLLIEFLTVSLVLATITGANYMQEQRQPKQQLAIITRTRKGCKYNSESRQNYIVSMLSAFHKTTFTI